MPFRAGITEPDNIGKQKHKTLDFENCNQWRYIWYRYDFHILYKEKLIYTQVKDKNLHASYIQDKELTDSFFLKLFLIGKFHSIRAFKQDM